MMLNQMPAGRPEPQWTKYYAGNAFEDCEWRVEEMEILGVKQKYILIRGTILSNRSLSIDMPADVTVSSPSEYPGTVIVCRKRNGKLAFWSTTITVNGSGKTIDFTSLFGSGSRFLIFARVK